MPVLRFQLARAARRAACRSATSKRLQRDICRAGRASVAGRPLVQHLHGRRHTQPVRAGSDRAGARGGAAPSARATPIEVTLEANPGTIERGRFAEYAAAGVNRVSLGAPELRCAARCRRSAASTRRRTRAGRRRTARRRPRQFQSRPDVRAAGPGCRGRGGRRRARARLCSRRTSRTISSPSSPAPCSRRAAALPGDDAAREMLERCQRALERGGLRAVRGLGVCARGTALRAQSQLLASATTWASAPARTAS